MTSPSRPEGNATWRVTDTGGLVTVQDRGRPGLAHLGVPRAGWLDPAAASLANRLVGNPDTTAVLEVAGGGLRLRLGGAGRWAAVCGAICDVLVDGTAREHGRPVWLQPGAALHLGPALTGVRSYLAAAGGIDVPAVLGSRSTDTLAWVGPPRVQQGAVLPLGTTYGVPAFLDVAAPGPSGPLRIRPGPRVDWFEERSFERLCAGEYAVTAASNRIGLRLEGPGLARLRHEELPSEGLVLGAVQVSPDGQPVVFLADHPTTGGYPVIAVVELADLGQCAQLRPGDPVRFSAVSSAVSPA